MLLIMPKFLFPIVEYWYNDELDTSPYSVGSTTTKKTWKKYVVVVVVTELNCGGGVLLSFYPQHASIILLFQILLHMFVSNCCCNWNIFYMDRPDHTLIIDPHIYSGVQYYITCNLLLTEICYVVFCSHFPSLTTSLASLFIHSAQPPPSIWTGLVIIFFSTRSIYATLNSWSTIDSCLFVTTHLL